MEDISSKVDVVYDHVVEAAADDYYVGNEAVGEEDKGEPMLLGSGTLPLRALRRTLKKSNRDVFVKLNMIAVSFPYYFPTRGHKSQLVSVFIKRPGFH